MRLASVTLHSWKHKELRLVSEEDWVLGVYDGEEQLESIVLDREWRELCRQGHYDTLAFHLVDQHLQPLELEYDEREYTVQVLTAVLPYML